MTDIPGENLQSTISEEHETKIHDEDHLFKDWTRYSINQLKRAINRCHNHECFKPLTENNFAALVERSIWDDDIPGCGKRDTITPLQHERLIDLMQTISDNVERMTLALERISRSDK